VGALRQGKLPAGEGQERLVQVMTTLNTPGPDLWPLGVRSATDVTGFGLTGHALTMARASGVSLILETSQLPLLPGAVQLCAAGFTCGGTRLNAAHVKPSIAYAQHIDEGMIGLLNDPQTSGGLLVAVPPERLADLLAALPAAGALCAAVIGEAREPVAGQPLRRCL
jgi:selenide,water dikinase